MSWREKLDELERQGRYRAAALLLARAIEEERDLEVLVAYANRLDELFLRRIDAVRAYLRIISLDPTYVGAWRRARAIQRSLGQLPTFVESLEDELRGTTDHALAADLFRQLGDALQDLGDHEGAGKAYQQALAAGPEDELAEALFLDATSNEVRATERMGELAKQAAGVSSGAACYLLLRAARIAARLGTAEHVAYLEAAIRAVPNNLVAHAELDSAFAARGDLEGLATTHERLLTSIGDAELRGRVAVEMAARWMSRFHDHETGRGFLRRARDADPRCLPAHVALVQPLVEGKDWPAALECLDEGLALVEPSGAPEPSRAFLLTTALEIAVEGLEDLDRAGPYVGALRQEVPDHPALRRFPSQDETELSSPKGAAPDGIVGADAEVRSASPGPSEEEATESMSSSNEHEDEMVDDNGAGEESPEMTDAAEAPRELTEEEQAKLAELDEQLAKFEGQKRWSDFIRTLVAKAEVHVDPAKKVELYSEAGRLYTEKSSSQADSIKCFEQVRAYDPYNVEALMQLRTMYEKRRDWEKLIGVMRAEAELMDPDDRPLRYVEMAELATQRLRKPDICIELWNLVLEADPENPDALAALVQLHERARNWEPLAAVLEKRVDALTEDKELKQQLQKLGMIYADKLGDDEGAVRAFSRLLSIDPNDRRAQEQLKRRYVALKAWDQLEEFYGQTEKWDELIRILEREADGKETSTEEKIELLFRAAHLWETKKEKSDRAARAYEKVLAVDPENLRAAEALTPIYEGARDAKKLVVVYEVRLRHMEDPAEKIMLLREAGLLYEDRLRKPEDAFERFLAAFATDPSQEVVREDVERLAAKVDGWNRVVEAYQGAIERAEYEDERIELQMNFGRVLSQMGNVEDAIAQYRAVYDTRSDHAEAIAALGELYRQTERYRDLLDVYERRLELETDPDQRLQLAYGNASLWENELADPDKAIDAYRAIIDEYGDEQTEAYRSLDVLYEQRGRYHDLAETLERRIDLGPESHEELAALKFRLARALEQHLEDKPRAVELYREVLSLMPEHDGAREALESLLSSEEVATQAAEILEPIYEVRGDWESLIRSLLVLHQGENDPDRRLELLTKVGEVYGERIGDQAKSFEAFCNALRERPDSEETLGRLEVLAVEQERFKDLVGLVSELAETTDDVDLSRTLWIKAAQMDDVQLENVDGAVIAYRKVLDQDPGDLEVLTALEELYRRTERWKDLQGILRRRAELEDDPVQQEEILAQMAFIYDNMLEAPDDAISVYKEILELDPASERALGALDDLYARQERWTELADNTDRQLAMAEDPERQQALMLRLAELRESKMGQVESAIEGFREVLEREPGNVDALQSLERLIQTDEHQLLIAEILEPIYRDSHQHEKLISVHEIQAQHARSPDRRVELLHRIAELYELALSDVDSAFQSFARALAEDPANEMTQDSLARLASMNANYEALAQVYEQRVAEIEDPQLRASIYVKAATVREDQLGDVPNAIAHYQKVLELDDQHIEAASALERLFQLSERYEDLAHIYMTKSAMLADLDEQKDYLFRAASIYEDILERPVEAIPIYDRVLEVDGEELRALDKLIELYLRLERWPELLEIYTRKADIVGDLDEKKRIYVETGAVYEREVGDVEKAIDTYQRILEIDPEDLTAIGRLDALYQSTENWQELLSVLEREADLAQDPNEVISYRYRIAELWHHRLDDQERAVDIYRDILEVIPEHPPTLQALESMIDAGQEPVNAAGVLEPVYRQLAQWPQLIRVHEVQIQHEEDPHRKVELLHAVAQLYEFELDQPQPGFEAFARALPVDAENEHTLGSLERLAENLGTWNEVTRLYDIEIQKLKDDSPDRLIEMALRTAQIYEVQVGDVDAAIARYKLVVDADEGHVDAIEALDRLYEATERWPELAEILQKEIPVAPSPDAILNLQFRLGQVHQSQLGQVDEAIQQYREILAVAPEHSPAMGALEFLFAEGVRPLVIGEVLEPLYRMQESWDKLLNVHEMQLNYQPDPNERVQMMHRIAEIGEEKAHDHYRAFVWMQRALLEDPAHDHTQAEVERLSSMLDGWAQLANTYADVLVNGASEETKALVGKKLARVYAEELSDVQRSEETYRYILSVQERDQEALEALDRIYSEYAAHEALAEVLKRRIGAAEYPDEQVELNYRLGQVLEADLGRTEEAIQVYKQVLEEHDEQHAESIRALQRIYTNREDWPNLMESFERELKVVVGDTAQSDVYARMARLASDSLGEPETAIGYWRQVLDLRGEDPEALNALGDIYAGQENWRDLVDILEREVSIADEDAMRVAVYSDLGRIWYEKLERDRNALDSWERVLDIDPTNTGALFAIAEIHRAANQNHELVDTLNRVIDVGAATLDDQSLENTYMQLGYLYSTELQQPLDAIDSYNRALDVNPSNFQAMDALEHIHRNEAMWEDCIQVMERRAQAIDDPAQKITVLLGVAEMWANEAGRPDEGTSAYQRILEMDPNHAHAFEKLEELHGEAMRWEDLIEMYIGRAESSEDQAERVLLLRKIAKVYEEQLADLDQAFDALNLAWSEDFSDRETSGELERVTRATNKWNELLTAANDALAQVEDPESKIAICLHCAKWYGQELGHQEYAIPYIQQIESLDPNNVQAKQQLAELYRATQQWQQLAQTLGSLVQMTNDPNVRAETYVQMGDLCRENLGIPEQATSYYTKALEENDQSVPALVALERIYREQERWPEYLDVLKRKADALEDEEEILAARLQIAEAYEDRLRDLDSAINTYQQVLGVDEVNLPALKGLERLYAHKERWQDLLQILEREFDVVTTEKERIAILIRLAGMWEEEFIKPDKAAERLEQVLEIDPVHDGALLGLARLYKGMQRWDELIATYERHISATPDRSEKCRLFKAMGETYAHELDDPDRGVDSYLNALEFNEDDVEALDALTRLYDKRGDHASALEMMEKTARVSMDPAQQIDLRYRMGRILDEQLGDRASAIDNYQAAIDVEPSHLPSLEAMRKIHIDSGEWDAAARVLEQEAQYTENPRVVSRLLVELGQICDERLDEHERAVSVFEASYKQDPDNQEAALPLANEYYGAERWDEAFPLLQMLVKRSGNREPDEQHRLAFMLGEVSTKLGNDEEAIRAFNKAYQLDSSHLPSLLGLAGSYYRTSDWEKAFKFYQMLLVHHRDSLGSDEITDIFYRLGVIKREQGERRKALNMFDKALEEDSYHRPTLEAVVGLYETQNEWEQVIHFKKQILEVADTDDERFDLLDQIGDLWKEKVGNQPKAIGAYSDASDIKPEDHKILHKLLIAYQETRQWEDAIEAIQRISDLDDRDVAKSKYAYTVGVIMRDELKDADRAVEKFNEALDIDSSQLKPFEAINKILTQKKDWKQLERAFRKMLRRVIGSGNNELIFNLWHNLGVIYRDRQNQYESAASAFQEASKLRPDDRTEHQILAELYAMIPERVTDAIREHQWMLRQDPYQVDSYRALYRLYFDAREYDKAWCLAATLTFLKKADAEQQQFYQQYKQGGMIKPQSRLDEERWLKDLSHPDEDPYVGKMFASVVGAVHALRASSDKALHLSKKHEVDPQTSTVTFARTYGFVSQVLNLGMVPRLFLRTDAQGGMVHVAGSNPPAVVCGQTLLSGFNPQDLTFVIGRQLTYYRAEHFIRTLMPSHSELLVILKAAMRLANVLPQSDPQTDQTAAQLQSKLNPQQADALRGLGRRFVEAGGRTDVKQWVQSVELTGCRAGFLLCNDLETAARMIQSLPPEGPVDLPPKDKIKEVVLFSVSEEYFRLRQSLGITINV
ncbi:MAG: tetratricopeptide repeat protein [Myxococcota bacterium]